MIKYPKIRLLGHKDNEGILDNFSELVIEEKTDGSNFRFSYDKESDKLVFGSRNIELQDENDNEMFKRCIEYIKENIDMKCLRDNYQNLVFFGEAARKHTVDYKWEEMPAFLGFDVFEQDDDGHWIQLNWRTSRMLFKSIGLEFVPVIAVGKSSEVKDLILNTDKFKSEFAVDGIAEGIVIKNYDKQLSAKKYSEGFKERFHKRYRKPKKYAETDNEMFMAVYVTDRAIHKQIEKLRDDGWDLERKMMKKLPSNVWSDIWEEEWQDIIFKSWKLDLKKLRKKIAKRCLYLLDNMITNESLNDL